MEEKNIILSLMFFTMAFAFYFITAVLYIGNLIFKKRWIGLTATAMACIALFSISMMLIARAGESGHAPFSNLYESMALFVWAMTIGYLVLEYKYKLRVLGFICYEHSLSRVWSPPRCFRISTRVSSR